MVCIAWLSVVQSRRLCRVKVITPGVQLDQNPVGGRRQGTAYGIKRRKNADGRSREMHARMEEEDWAVSRHVAVTASRYSGMGRGVQVLTHSQNGCCEEEKGHKRAVKVRWAVDDEDLLGTVRAQTERRRRGKRAKKRSPVSACRKPWFHDRVACMHASSVCASKRNIHPNPSLLLSRGGGPASSTNTYSQSHLGDCL